MTDLAAGDITADQARSLTDRIKVGFDDVARLRRDAERAGLLETGRRSRTDRRSVYFIAATTSCMVKIGVASSPPDRLRQLATAAPERLELVAVIPGAGQAGEAALHAKLARSRSHGEWFYPTAEVMAAVAEASR